MFILKEIKLLWHLGGHIGGKKSWIFFSPMQEMLGATT